MESKKLCCEKIKLCPICRGQGFLMIIKGSDYDSLPCPNPECNGGIITVAEEKDVNEMPSLR